MSNKGILLHISSLPSPYGIGSLGKQAYNFADFLKETKQNLWQVLPINPTEHIYGSNSPYSALSVFAFNTYFIDLDLLCEDGLLDKKDYFNIKWFNKCDKVNYQLLFNNREKILVKCYKNFNVNDIEYKKFCRENDFWLDDFALFSVIKKINNNKEWSKWNDSLRIYKKTELSAELNNICEKYNKEIECQKVLQYLFLDQWIKLKQYCNNLNIKIIGDLPIYSAYNSSDVWANNQIFQLNKNLFAEYVAGVPPDYFSSSGQHWGNPLYDWQYIASTQYQWWKDRFKQAAKLYDIYRIDHFKGFESYYKIPSSDKNAVNGFWEKGPGINLFNKLKKETSLVKIIAEDLGYINDEVRKMLKKTGFASMKVLQFAFDNGMENEHLPHHYNLNNAVYTGTHDNNTLNGWYDKLGVKQRLFIKQYLNIVAEENAIDKLIKAVLNSSAKYKIIPMQDYLNLGEEARMNTPSTVNGNWEWRLTKRQINYMLISKINSLLS